MCVFPIQDIFKTIKSDSHVYYGVTIIAQPCPIDLPIRMSMVADNKFSSHLLQELVNPDPFYRIAVCVRSWEWLGAKCIRYRVYSCPWEEEEEEGLNFLLALLSVYKSNAQLNNQLFYFSCSSQFVADYYRKSSGWVC